MTNPRNCFRLGACLASGFLSFLAQGQTVPQVPVSATVSSISPPVVSSIQQAVELNKGDLVRLYQDLHAHPELAFMERRTAGVIAQELQALGFEVHTGIGTTGVVAVMRNGVGPVVMYRADMDALPIEEATQLPYASKTRAALDDGTDTPVAHMCGHDAHVTWMLGMAKVMARTQGDWRGTLVLVAQPAEETGGGAKRMVAEDFYQRLRLPTPDYLLALHTAPMPVGMVATNTGTLMSGSEQLDVVFHGRGGHGSMPHITKDPVVMGSMAVTQYQTVVSRMNNPLDTAVLTVGAFHAGQANNVIPDKAVLKLNLRYFNPTALQRLHQGIEAVNRGIATSYGMVDTQPPTLITKGSTTPLVNDAALVKKVQLPLKAVFGAAQVIDQLPPAMGSEDAHLLKGKHTYIPLAYMFVGVANPVVFKRAAQQGRATPYDPHTPHYVVDLDAIPVGTLMASLITMELLVK